MIETLPILAWSCREDGTTEFVSQRWLDYTGLSPEAALRSGWEASLHPDDAERWMGTWRRLLATGKPGEEEARLRRFDGVYRWFLFRAVPVTDEQGRVVGWHGTNTDIEDLKQAQDVLREREERFRCLADRLPEVIWITALAPEEGVLYASPSFERIWGLPVQELYQNPRLWTETIHPEDRGRIAAALSQWIAAADRNHRDVEFRIVQPNGDIRWIHERSVISTDDTGKPLRASGISTDITERKRAEGELRRSEAYLREAQRLSLTGSFGWRVGTGDLIWSRETFSILGYDPATRPTLALVLQRAHPEDRLSVQQAIDAALHDETDIDFEHRLLMPNGSIKHVHVVAHAVRDVSGCVEYVGAVSDVTARKTAEETIRQDERELRQIVEAIPELILVLTPDGDPFHANARVLEYTGLTLDDVQAGGFRERVFHPTDVERLREERRQALARGLPFEMEQRVRRKDGQYRWFLTRLSPLRDEQGRILRWYATGSDIDDRKRAEERIRRENFALREEIDIMFEEVVGTSPALRAVLERVAKVAPTDSTVLITGETGTGKELIARAIHKRSSRAAHVFVSVNCAAVPPALIASELFGHEKGAFTGASQRRLGRFELADGGTLFLDEVGDLPAETQVALLRVLQEREFERVGGTQAIRADVRVISAANRDLPAAIAAGAFRRDLYYRLNVFPIEMPPLRDRPEDIPLLVEYFVDRYARQAGKKVRSVSRKTFELLQSYPWPGNIRELQNVVERSVIVCETDTFSVDKSWLCGDAGSTPATLPLPRTPVSPERERIEAALAETRGRVSGPSGAAAKLGLPPSTLESKIRSLKINKHRFKIA
jgi:PAS domain S-box-containing protein